MTHYDRVVFLGECKTLVSKRFPCAQRRAQKKFKENLLFQCINQLSNVDCLDMLKY